MERKREMSRRCWRTGGEKGNREGISGKVDALFSFFVSLSIRSPGSKLVSAEERGSRFRTFKAIPECDD